MGEMTRISALPLKWFSAYWTRITTPTTTASRRVVVRVRRVLLVVAKINATVQDVRAVHPVGMKQPTTRNMNVSLPDMGTLKAVVVPFQITVWVANFGFGNPVRNALLEVIHTIESMPPHPYRPDRTARHHQKIFSNE